MNAWHFIATDWAAGLGWTVLHSLWQGAVISLLLAAALTSLRNRSPQARYLAALIAMSALLASAALTFKWVSARTGTQAHALSPVGDETHGVQPAFGRLDSTTSISRQVDFAPHPMSSARSRAAWIEPALPLIAVFWAAGVLLFSCWNLGGWIAAQRLRAIRVQPADHSLASLTQTLARRLGLRRPVRVLISLIAQTPMVIGWLRPALLIPAAQLTGLTSKQIEGILAHELTHIRRHDYAINLLQVLAETLLFYHPAVWWISRRVRLERERCCDEIALSLVEDRYAYAGSLAALEELRLGTGVALAASGSGDGELTKRIKTILRLDDPAPRRTARLIIAAALLLAGAALPLSFLRGGAALPSDSKATTQPEARAVHRLQFRLVAEAPIPKETEEFKDPDSGQAIHVRRHIELDEADVKDAQMNKSPSGELSVGLDFTSAGADKLAALTGANLNKKLAIVFDGKLLLAPTIRSKIFNSLSVTAGSGGFTNQQARELVNAVHAAPKPINGTATTDPAGHAEASFRAECALSGVVDGKRQLLASPILNLEDASETSFLFTGKPPVVIQQLPCREAGILATVSVQQQSDGRLRVVCRISRRVATQSEHIQDDDAALLEKSQSLAALQKRLIEARLLAEAARRESDFRHDKRGASTPYTAQEIARVDPAFAQKEKDRQALLLEYQYLRDTYGSNYPTVVATKQRLELWQKTIDEDVKKFNQSSLIVEQPDGQPGRIVAKDLPKLWAAVEECRRACDEESAAIKQILRVGGIQTDQTVRAGEPVAVELDDGTRLEVSVHPSSN